MPSKVSSMKTFRIRHKKAWIRMNFLDDIIKKEPPHLKVWTFLGFRVQKEPKGQFFQLIYTHRVANSQSTQFSFTHRNTYITSLQFSFPHKKEIWACETCNMPTLCFFVYCIARFHSHATHVVVGFSRQGYTDEVKECSRPFDVTWISLWIFLRGVERWSSTFDSGRLPIVDDND